MASPKSIKNALSVFVEVHGQDGQATLDAELLNALREHFGELPVVEATDDELAEAAFDLLCDVPEYREPLKALVDGPPPESFGIVSTAAVLVAVVFALKTHVRFKRSPNGKWEVLIEKKPSTDKLVTNLVSSLLGRLGVSGDKVTGRKKSDNP